MACGDCLHYEDGESEAFASEGVLMRPAITHGGRWKEQRWSAIVLTFAFVFAATSGAAVALAADDEGAPFSPRPSNPSRFTADA